MKRCRPPFNMLIVGPTFSGKTFYLLEMLEKDYAGTFDHIVLLCPTILYNKTYHRWRYFHNDDFISLPVEQDSVDEMLRFVVDTYKETNTLIILDDCASGQDLKNRTSELVKLGFSARHYGLSTIVLTQQLTSIAKPFRENISKLVTFYNTNRKDMQTLINDYLNNVGKEETENISKVLKDVKYSRLEINLRHPFDYKVCK